MRVITFTFNVGDLNKYINNIDTILLKNHLNNIFKPSVNTIYFISTQEDTKKSFLITNIISIFSPVTYLIHSSYFSSWSKDFNIHNLIIIPYDIFNDNNFKFLDDVKINHNLIYSKGSIIKRLSNSDTDIYFIASHLPMNKHKDDLGLSERITAMKSVVNIIKKRLINIKKDNYILWIGDLNFRINNDQEQLDQSINNGLIDYDIIFEDLSQIDNYEPTCKTMMFNQKVECDQTCLIKDKSCKKPCYDIKSKSGNREPSYCDRILGWSNVSAFNNFTTISLHANKYDFIQYSDHNPIISNILLPEKMTYNRNPYFKGGNINYNEKINKYKNKYKNKYLFYTVKCQI